MFRHAAMRVAERVYVAAMEAGDRDAAVHAWRRLTALIAQRSPEEVAAMERQMGAR
jgi:hypothetical protein